MARESSSAKRNRRGGRQVKKAIEHMTLSSEALASVSGGTIGGGAAAMLRKTLGEEKYNARAEKMQDPVGLGNVIMGIAERDFKKAALGAVGVAATVIPGGAAMTGLTTGVKVGLQAAKIGAKGYQNSTRALDVLKRNR